jgi:DNA-binding SARP family transcriptional activator
MTGLPCRKPDHANAPGLRVDLLGPPAILWRNEPWPIPRRQARALLFCLAAEEQNIPRERALFLFWPDLPEALARRSLTRLLTHLRRALPDPGALVITPDTLCLDPQRAQSDLGRFRLACAAPDACPLPDLRRAVDLYRGPLLDGFCLPGCPEFESWAVQARSAIERLYLKGLDTLIDRYASSGAIEDAIACARRYLAADELAESVHRRLIALYHRIGDRRAALQQFEACAVILERELGVSPLPNTQSAYHDILRHPAPTEPVTPGPPPAWTTLPSLRAPLVGRGEAMAQLQKAFASARAGAGRVMLISGEPGIGKSRLMQDFAARLDSDAPMLVGSSHEPEHHLPYWPLIEALRPQARSQDWIGLGVAPGCLAEVARILPELRAALPGLPDPAPARWAEQQASLFHALAEWLTRWAAARPPLVLCLDDLHWADPSTLACLSYLGRVAGHAPLLMIGAYRSEEAAALAPLRSELARQGGLREIALRGLPEAEVLQLIRHLSGQAGGAEPLSRCLHRETGGNPFFLLETLRVLFETGALQQGEAGWLAAERQPAGDDCGLPLPDTVSHAIRDRISRLSPGARQVLEAAAVIGPRFDLEMVRKTSGRHESEVVDALDALLARQVISESDGAYRFNHDLIRAVVQNDLSLGRRRLLHHRAGQALARLHPEAPAALAWHYERAGEWKPAAEHALRASRQAREVFAYVEARRYCDLALSALEREAGQLRVSAEVAANRRLRIQALHERGWVLRLLGDMDAYERDSEEVNRLAEALGDRRALAHLRWREANTHRWFCRYTRALAAARDGLRLSHEARDRELEAVCRREIGLAAREAGDVSQARIELERALALFRDLRLANYEIHTLGNLSTLALNEGRIEEAARLAEQALARCEETGLPLERRLPLGDRGAAAAAAGDADIARPALMESLAIASRIADRTQEILCLGHLGWLAARVGQPAEAVQQLEAALALAQRVASPTEQSWLHAGLAQAYRLSGDGCRALRHAELALALARRHGRPLDEALARRILAAISL